MGLININTIGAFIITILLLGIILRRPSPKKIEAFLNQKLKFYHNFLLLSLMILVLLTTSSQLESDSWLINIPEILIDGLTTWIHEAGHIYWLWGGPFMHYLGGTLNEILFPFIPFAYCLWKGHLSLAGLFVYWLGLNCFGISAYVGDARAMQLPLLGTGGTDGHDWNFLLGELGLLKWDQDIAHAIQIFGWCFSLLGLLIFTNFGGKLISANLLSPYSAAKNNTQPFKQEGNSKTGFQ